MTKNYYQILGVSEFCTDQEIKNAYRKLARKWHPDVAGNTEDIVAKFKDINEAYSVLSNPSDRISYDTSRRFYNYSSTTKKSEEHAKKGTTEPNFHSAKEKQETKKEDNNTKDEPKSGFKFNWDEFISKYREYSQKDNSEEKTRKAKYGNTVRGKDIYTDVELNITEAINGTTKIINMIHTHACPKCNGRKFANGMVCPNCKGSGEISDYKRFSIKIPAGIKNGSKIRLSGEGEKGLNGGSNGDLYVTVHIKAPLDYTVDGLNVLKIFTLAPFEAVLGGTFSVQTLDGNVNLKIPANTQSGQKIRLSGCGIKKNGKTGDMILTIEIKIPKNISTKEIELYKQLREISTSTVR